MNVKSRIFFQVSDLHNMLFCNGCEVEGIKLNHIVLVYLIDKGFVNVKPPKSCHQTMQICAWNSKEKEVLACIEDGGR